MLFTFTPLFLSVASLAGLVSADDKHNGETNTNTTPRKPIGIHKMTNDQGEKFYMHYWQYENDMSIAANTTTSERTFLPRSYNFQPPFALGLKRFADLRSSPLSRRNFECPTGTNACTSINRPDSCCGTDETCVVVEDTGSGDVGCCPAGQDCSGTIGSCWEGYTSCPSSLGGGCCFPGYECVEEGCSHVVTITLTLSSTTVTTTSTETVAPTSTSTTTTEETTSTTTSTSTSTNTSISTTSTSTSTSTTSSTSSTDLSPPDRPTSASTTTSSETETTCPTGFYACEAVYQGGCCQTGRNCDTSSCPAMSSSTIVSEGRTIVIAEPTDAPSAEESSNEGDDESGTKRCATGWFSCADTVGGGCCPTGYACGSSCTAVPTASTTGTVAKEEPTVESGGANVKTARRMLSCAMFMAWMML